VIAGRLRVVGDGSYCSSEGYFGFGHVDIV
jgi:hypothetical protein